MGAEAHCQVRVGRETFDANVLLETDELIVRGENRLTIPFKSIYSVQVKDGVLTLGSPARTVQLHLGPKADRWAAKIRSPKSRIEKLGVKHGSVVLAIGLDDPTFVTEMVAAGARLIDDAAGTPDLIFLGVPTTRDLPRIARQAKTLPKTAALWVIHPKGPAGVKDTDIFAVAKKAGLTYTKVARFSETHTAERLGWPKSAR